MRNLTIKLLLGAVVTAFVGGAISVAAASSASLREQADALCEVYNPDNWTEFHYSGDMAGFSDELAKRIRETIESDELMAIYQQLSERYHEEPQAFIRNEIRKIVGEDWDCQYLVASTQQEAQ